MRVGVQKDHLRVDKTHINLVKHPQLQPNPHKNLPNGPEILLQVHGRDEPLPLRLTTNRNDRTCQLIAIRVLERVQPLVSVNFGEVRSVDR